MPNFDILLHLTTKVSTHANSNIVNGKHKYALEIGEKGYQDQRNARIGLDNRKPRHDACRSCVDREFRVNEDDAFLYYCSKILLSFILSFAVRKDSVSAADVCL